MATKIDYYKNDSSASIVEEGDGELWLAPAFTVGGGALFMSITDFETKTEAGILLPLPALKWIATYYESFIEAAEGLPEDEGERLGGSE